MHFQAAIISQTLSNVYHLLFISLQMELNRRIAISIFAIDLSNNRNSRDYRCKSWTHWLIANYASNEIVVTTKQSSLPARSWGKSNRERTRISTFCSTEMKSCHQSS